MTTQEDLDSLLLFTPEQLEHLKKMSMDFNATQLTWISGYFFGLANLQTSTIVASVPKLLTQSLTTITLISASQTGNARQLAQLLYNDLREAKLTVNLSNASDYNFKQINKETFLVVITSTHGEGEPPDEALGLYKFLMSNNAPNFKNTAFAVFGLGDTSYEFFSQIGKDFDTRFAELGAERLLDRVDADIEYHEQAVVWRKQLTEILKMRILSNPSPNKGIRGADNSINKIYRNVYNKENPFSTNILINQKITGRYSDRDVRHIEINLGNSDLCYQPGDAVGIWYENDIVLVQEIMELLGLQYDELVNVGNETLSLNDALKKYFELTVNTPKIIEKYAILSSNDMLLRLINNKLKLKSYAQSVPIVDMMRQAPTLLKSEQLLTLLRRLTPRLYSISSAQSENETEVHITVSVVRYKINERARGGGASTFLADRIAENDVIRIFIESNQNFRLPIDLNTPIIMIGSGTGIAPFRAFMQQRIKDKAIGKNWLFFGNPHFTEDFLYQLEWQKYVRDGLLTNIDLAWSRDQLEKVYVQDKIREKGDEVWHWIKEGAHLYVCGNAKHMAKDVEHILLEILVKHGEMTFEMAHIFLNKLRTDRRYQRDIY
ncbi:sulfite reductase [NADPH] flavoprotein alpha-component [Candidatus Pantoea carbekii]|uniref:Sulfite reductase [NADPH] flavoprotein alpha-component n=1 Tax=Candidatus Pantoea carbekii TaxID=1235990 RepID=U3U8Z4_9GAMM|nr:sulfite reductase [NADPH] flavoprotein alpha-component [Candidatus Pantoea carbekii]